METEGQWHSTFLLDIPLIAGAEIKIYSDFLQTTLSAESRHLTELLESIPYPRSGSYGPLAVLSALVSAIPDQWPVLDLQLAYVKAWKTLPEDAKSGRAPPQAQQLLDRALLQCKQCYSSLLDLLHPSSTAIAVIDPGSGRSMQHDALAALVRSFSLPLPVVSAQPKPVVAISLPNGTLLALTVLATATYYTTAPIGHGSGVGAEQFRSDILRSNAEMVLVTPSDVVRLGLRDAWLREAGIKVLLVELGANMNLIVRDLDGRDMSTTSVAAKPTPIHPDDTGILLFTSGTSGTKKVVPLSIHSMVCGIAMVKKSWGLTKSMRGLNQMPLNHVGGLIRNLLTPIVSGGVLSNVVLCLTIYASVHQCILEAAVDRPESAATSQIQLVCIAAGGLLPSLARQLRDVFSTGNSECIVLPSYGMTECMPITTPPLDYKLDKPGTSGVSTGTEISVVDHVDSPLKSGVVGRICVRGLPVFGGYLQAHDGVDKSCFMDSGWFDTGDIGYLDDENYLFITGRSKEVINRGGELISPFEVEEAVVAAANDASSPIYGRVMRALAFSVAHDVLQEVVGLCIVTPAGSSRPSLYSMQQSLQSILSQFKNPVLLVYMDDGLPINNNKLLRIKLAERLCLPQISDDTPQVQRHYEAICPPPNTPLSKPIVCFPLKLDRTGLVIACEQLLPPEFDVHFKTQDFNPEVVVAPKLGLSEDFFLDKIVPGELVKRLADRLHDYDVPSTVHLLDKALPCTRNGSVDSAALETMLISKAALRDLPILSVTQTIIAGIFAKILSQATNNLSAESDFFDLGGDSMKAGRLLSSLRKEFQLRLSIDELFINRKISDLATLIESKTKTNRGVMDQPRDPMDEPPSILPGCDQTFSSTKPVLLLLHLVPLCLLYPMKRAFTWTVFMYCLAYTQRLITNETIPGRLTNLVVSMMIARTVTRTLAPIIAVITKWLIIGRYREGLYPMWSHYHSRWWLCQKVIQVAGIGIFNTFNWSRCLYYRSLGAKIGKNVTLNKGITFGEADLVTIEDGANLERCVIRPFASERNTSMYLGRITIGSYSSVGLGSVVAAGTSLKQYTCLGPNSSSWETQDACEANRDLATSSIPSSHWALTFFIGLPLQMVTLAIGALPWLGCLTILVIHEPKGDILDELRQITIWFASPERVGLHYAALAANAAVGPALLFFAVFIIKKTFDTLFGKLMPGDTASISGLTRFRTHLMRALMPTVRFHKLTALFGSHYESTSLLMRAMGAKIGKRVYWPGTGPSIQDFHLLSVGNDVVFGSRAHLVTSDGVGSDYIRIKDGAMVADRVVLLPGVQLGEDTVMGSGALTQRGARYPPATTWVGSKGGKCVCITAPMEKALPPVSSLLSYNSSCTTLAHHSDSEASSFSVVEKGSIPVINPVGESKLARNGVTQKGGLTVRFADQEIPATSKLESSSPFGRAIYEGLTLYRVWGQFEVFLYSTFITITTTIYWNVGSISAVQVIARIFSSQGGMSPTFLAQAWYRPFTFFGFFLTLTMLIMFVQSITTLLLLIAAKWLLMGRRRPGCYSWDLSSYCQRWQLHLKLESFRRHCYGGNGILGMLTGSYWIVLYFRALGADIGKDCALFAGGSPSLMFTEPDLLTLGNRVTVDDASLVCHINTRGKFDLNPLFVGDRSVLRTGSRLLSGARMENDTCLLEHTLVMAGDVVEAGSTMQGWPAEDFTGSRMPRMKAKQTWATIS